MRNLMLLLHLVGAITWLGGMTFMLLALRPAAHDQLQPPVRLPLIQQVLRRFFLLVTLSIALLLPTGVVLLLAAPAGAGVPPGWHVMAGLGLVMIAIFGHIFFSPWRRLKAALAAQDLAEGGRRMKQITWLVALNLLLGWVAVAAVLLLR